MKQLKFLSSAAIVMLMLFSCNSGSDEKTSDTTTTDTTSTDATTAQKPAETPEKPVLTMLIKHKVANFAKWMPAYEADDSARVAYGLHNFVVSRGTKDSNMVMIALHMDDTAKAKQFSMMPQLKATMQRAGVMGAPTITYTETEWHDTTTNSSTDRVIIMQKVKDWDAWKKAFDSHKQVRMDAGLTDRAVGHTVSDPHMVSVVLAISDMKKAEDFAKSKDLKDKMAEAGVVGAPDIFFYHVVKQW
ncbi:MAG: hypothetical protein ABIN97_16385 [Ginsengibacter sp.]